MNVGPMLESFFNPTFSLQVHCFRTSEFVDTVCTIQTDQAKDSGQGSKEGLKPSEAIRITRQEQLHQADGEFANSDEVPLAVTACCRIAASWIPFLTQDSADEIDLSGWGLDRQSVRSTDPKSWMPWGFDQVSPLPHPMGSCGAGRSSSN